MSSRLNNKLVNLRYLPRWIILLIDLFLIVCALVFAKLLMKSPLLGVFLSDSFYTFSACFIIGHLVFFMRFKTFAGVVRHTTIIDATRILWAELSVLLSLLTINFIFEILNQKTLFDTFYLFLCSIISYTLLLLFRMSVKVLFESFKKVVAQSTTIPTIILGCEDRALAVANAIETETPKKFHLLGFVSKKEYTDKAPNRLLGFPLFYSQRRVSVLARKLGASAVIIADTNIDNQNRMQLVDDCLNYNIKVYNLPVLTDVTDMKSVASNIRNVKIQDLLNRKPIVLNNQLIRSQIQGKVVLVSGGAGSIGSEIVFQVSKFEPSKIIVLDQAETALNHITLEYEKAGNTPTLIPIIADIRDRKILNRIFKQHQPDIVYHAAAYKHVPLMENTPEQAVFTNVLGTKNLADTAVENNVGRFVMVSTDKAVNPSNIMGASKRIAEIYVQSLNQYLNLTSSDSTKFITTRFGNVLGSNGSVVPLFSKQIEQGGPITITHPDIIRYFMTIPEACQLVLEAGSMGNGGEIFIFDMGQPVKIIDLAYKMIKLVGLTPEKDIKIKIVGLRPGEKLYEELLNDTSTTLPTHHEKIMVAKDEHLHFKAIEDKINHLKDFAISCRTLEMVKCMKEIVPEFKSLNSEFEKLD